MFFLISNQDHQLAIQLGGTPLTSAEELTQNVERFLQMWGLKGRHIIILKEGTTMMERQSSQKTSYISFTRSPVTEMALNQQQGTNPCFTLQWMAGVPAA